MNISKKIIENNFLNTDLIYLFILLIIPCIFFQYLFLSVPGDDNITWWYPTEHIKPSIVDIGDFPKWSPYMWGGYPFIADPLTQMFYPISLILRVLPVNLSISMTYLLHIILGGLSAYFLARVLKIGAFGALISGLVYILSSWFLGSTHNGYMGIVVGSAYIPLIFGCFELTLQRKNLFYSVLTGTAIGFQILGSHPQPVFYTFFAMFLYLLYKIFTGWRKGERKQLVKYVYLFGIALLIGFSLAAIQLLPIYEYSKYGLLPNQYSRVSALNPFRFFKFTEGSIFPFQIYGLLIKGGGILYLGVIPILLAVVAAFYKFKNTKFYVYLIGLALVLSMGKYSPVYWLFYFIPGFNAFRRPFRIVILLLFAFSVLAGFGADYLINQLNKNGTKRLTRILIIGVGVIVFLFITNSIFHTVYINHMKEIVNVFNPIYQDYALRAFGEVGRNLPKFSQILFAFLMIGLFLFLIRKYDLKPTYKKIAILALIFIEYVVLHIPSVINTSWRVIPNNYFPRNKIISFLENDKDMFRILCLGSTGQPDGFKTNQNIMVGISDVNGFSLFNLRRYVEFSNIINNEEISKMPHHPGYLRISNYDNKLINLLNVKYVISKEEISSDRFNFILQDGQVRLYKNNLFHPRFYYVFDYKVIKDEKDMIQQLQSADFDYTNTVLLEEEPEIKPEGNSQNNNLWKIKISKYAQGEIVLRTNSQEDGFLMLSEIYAPGWKVYVDGKKGKIYRANYVFRAVPMEKGHHEVKFIFAPTSFKIGAFITLLSFWAILTTVGIKAVEYYQCRPGRDGEKE